MSIDQVFYWVGATVCVMGGIGMALGATAFAMRQAFKNCRVLNNSWNMYLRLLREDALKRQAAMQNKGDTHA